MKPSLALQLHRASVRSVVERHRASKARVFGFVLPVPKQWLACWIPRKARSRPGA